MQVEFAEGGFGEAGKFGALPKEFTNAGQKVFVFAQICAFIIAGDAAQVGIKIRRGQLAQRDSEKIALFVRRHAACALAEGERIGGMIAGEADVEVRDQGVVIFFHGVLLRNILSAKKGSINFSP